MSTAKEWTHAAKRAEAKAAGAWREAHAWRARPGAGPGSSPSAWMDAMTSRAWESAAHARALVWDAAVEIATERAAALEEDAP